MLTAPVAARAAARPAPACACCGETAWDAHFRALRRCRDCGHVAADMDLPPALLRQLYSEDYFRGQEYGDYVADAAAHRRNARFRLRLLTRYAGRPRKVFEVGCAYGFWLECLSRAGIPSAGVDVCPEAVAYAADVLGQRAEAGDFLRLPLAAWAYDCYCLWDTIEHLAHPDAFVARIAELLPPGGWFAATTGDMGSVLARFRGPRWRMIHPPTHLHYFTRGSMARLLERHGLEPVVFRSLPVYRNLRGILSGLRILGRGLTRRLGAGLEAVLPVAVQERAGFWLNLGDIMFVIARKVG
jgi:SAM-dependent methyltransferase